jgi:hypothetical protein
VPRPGHAPMVLKAQIGDTMSGEYSWTQEVA